MHIMIHDTKLAISYLNVMQLIRLHSNKDIIQRQDRRIAEDVTR